MEDFTFRIVSVFFANILFFATLLSLQTNITGYKFGNAKWYYIFAFLFFIAGFANKFCGGYTSTSDSFYHWGWFLVAWGLYLSRITEKIKRSKINKFCRCLVMIFASLFYFGTPWGLPSVESYPNEFSAEFYRQNILDTFYVAIIFQIIMLVFALLLRRRDSKNCIDTIPNA